MASGNSPSHLHLGFGLTVCLMFMLLAYCVLYEMGPQTIHSYEPTSASKVRLSNLQGVVAKAGSVLSRLGIRDSVPGYDDNNSNASSTHTSSSTIPSMPNVDKTLLGNIQEYLRKLSEVDRSGDEYANEKIYRHDDQYLQYMNCPTSVHKKMLDLKEMNMMKQTYIPDIPLLMWNKHLDRVEYDRLKQFGGIYGWSNMEYDDIASGLKVLNSPRDQYLFDDRLDEYGNLPRNDSACIRCAVIGNGGMMNGSKMGKEIDANDYVFRVNTALTKGYEDDVGTRTSFYCFTLTTLTNTLAGSGQFGFKSPPGNDDVKYLFFANDVWTYQLIHSYILGKDPPRSPDHRSPPKFPKKLTTSNVKVVHPDFERYIKWSWVNSKDQHKDIHIPTTGAIMMLFALHTCDEVNAYGFGGSYIKYSEHYYEKSYHKHVNYANHDNNAENNLWTYLHDIGVINLYHRD